MKKSKARRVTRVAKVKATKPVREVAKLDQAEVIMTFAGNVAGWHRQSLLLSCTAAVALIVGLHAKGKPVEQSETVERLKKSINGKTGLKDAQVHKYIGLARALVNHLTMRFKIAGPVHDVLLATTPSAAIESLTGYLGTQKVNTLEGLTVMFGKYRRTKPKSSAARKRESERTVQRNGRGMERPARIGTELPGTASAHAELVSTLGSTPADTLVLVAVQAGHIPVQIAEYAVNLCTTPADVAHLEEVLTTRGKQISEHRAPVVTHIGEARRARAVA